MYVQKVNAKRRGYGIAPIVGAIAAPVIASVTEPLTAAITGAITTKVEGLIAGATGAASASRTDRNAALAAAVSIMQGVKAIVESTTQFKGQVLADPEYNSLLGNIIQMWNSFIEAANNYKRLSGIAGFGALRGWGILTPGIISQIKAGMSGDFGRTAAEKLAARAAGVALATRNTRTSINVALENISAGRKVVQIPMTTEQVDKPVEQPADPAAQAAQRQVTAAAVATEKKGIASLLPYAAIALFLLK